MVTIYTMFTYKPDQTKKSQLCLMAIMAEVKVAAALEP